MEQQTFINRVALVTGSSRGIGYAIAQNLSAAGADVVIHHRKRGGSSQAKAENLRCEIEGAGRRALVVEADIAKKSEVQKLFDEIRGFFGRLDFLILNAARAPFKPIERLLERDLRQLVDTNYLGNIFCLQEAVPLLENTQGKVVFLSSLGSRFYNPSYPLGSLKAAMEDGVATAGVVAGVATDWSDPGIQAAVNFPVAGRPVELRCITATGTLTPPTAGTDLRVVLNGTSVIALTIAAPTKDLDGCKLTIVSNGAAAHTLTFTGGLSGAGSSYDVITVNATAPAAFEFIAANTLWMMLCQAPMGGTVTNIIGSIA